MAWDHNNPKPDPRAAPDCGGSILEEGGAAPPSAARAHRGASKPEAAGSAEADLDLAVEALVAELGAAREEAVLARRDLVALEDREAVVEVVAGAVVAVVGARLGEELGGPLPLGLALGGALASFGLLRRPSDAASGAA